MKSGYYLQRCCYVGCQKEHYLELWPLPTLEQLKEELRIYEETGISLDDGQFMTFAVQECEGRIYCTEDFLCPWHEGDCKSVTLFSGELCREHFEMFRGEDFGDYFANIAKADPELFDKARFGEYIEGAHP